jgi:hypothetical protein
LSLNLGKLGTEPQVYLLFSYERDSNVVESKKEREEEKEIDSNGGKTC